MSIYRVALAKGHVAKTGVKVCIVSLLWFFKLITWSFFVRKFCSFAQEIILYLFKGSVRVLSPIGVTANFYQSRSCSR